MAKIEAKYEEKLALNNKLKPKEVHYFGRPFCVYCLPLQFACSFRHLTRFVVQAL